MNCFVSFCYSETIGGGQNYLNSKTEWLESIGWLPIVFTSGKEYPSVRMDNKAIPWNGLRRFSRYKSFYISKPPEFWPRFIVKRELKKMARCVPKDVDQIIIESHTDYWAEWGELLAKRLHAKNYCFLLDELLEYYGAKEFLFFKFQRHEVAGIHNSSMNRLFNGIIDIPIDDTYVLRAANFGSVADVENEAVSQIKREDYNIAYIGRDKQYVQSIVNGIVSFAEKHTDKTVHFIVVGSIKETLLSAMESHANIKVSLLGFLLPIPRAIFAKIDLVIAGAGCASLAAKENVPVIVADAASLQSNGILGYTTDSTLFSDESPRPFVNDIEDVLVNRILENKKRPVFQRVDPTREYRKHFDFFSRSSDSSVYFDFIRHPQRFYSLKFRIKTRLKWYWPSLYQKLFLT